MIGCETNHSHWAKHARSTKRTNERTNELGPDAIFTSIFFLLSFLLSSNFLFTQQRVRCSLLLPTIKGRAFPVHPEDEFALVEERARTFPDSAVFLFFYLFILQGHPSCWGVCDCVTPQAPLNESIFSPFYFFLWCPPCVYLSDCCRQEVTPFVYLSHFPLLSPALYISSKRMAGGTTGAEFEIGISRGHRFPIQHS